MIWNSADYSFHSTSHTCRMNESLEAAAKNCVLIRVWGGFVWGPWQPGRTGGPQKVQTHENVCIRHYDA
jgi:hypothetical protein